MASLMRRAVQQAKAEAAAEAAAAAQSAAGSDNGQTTVAQKGTEAPANGKKALAGMLRRAAQKMQADEAKAQLQPAAGPSDPVQQPSSPKEGQEQQQMGQLTADGDNQLPPPSEQTDWLDPDELQLLDVNPSSNSSPDLHNPQSNPAMPIYKTPSLGARLGSLLKSALAPSTQSSYMPLDADSSPEADAGADQSSGQLTQSANRRAPARDASLGQKLGSLVKGALSLSRQPSYVPLQDQDNEDPDASDALESLARSPVARELSLRERFAPASPRQSGHMPGADNTGHVLSRESSLQRRSSSLSLSREPSMSLRAPSISAGFGAMEELSVPASPGRRRALPRDASYLPEWVTRTHSARGAPVHGDGTTSPRSRLGTASSNASAESDLGDDSFAPKWVDWPASARSSPRHSLQLSPSQLGREDEGHLAPAGLDLTSPVQLERQEQEPQQAAAAPPRKRRPLDLAVDPLSLAQTPPTNPQLDGTAMPVATPKGQRLFEFWHQMAEQQQPSAAGTATHTPARPDIILDAGPQPVPADAPQQAQHAQQAQQQQQAQHTQQAQHAPHTHQALHVQPAKPPESSLQEQLAQTAGAGSVQFGVASAALVAELETASRLVHTQSLQQAQLLEGLERALSQLSEHRLLIQNPQPDAAVSQQMPLKHAGMSLTDAVSLQLLQLTVSPCPAVHTMHLVAVIMHHIPLLYMRIYSPVCNYYFGFHSQAYPGHKARSSSPKWQLVVCAEFATEHMAFVYCRQSHGPDARSVFERRCSSGSA